jgi:hypothetical protein
MVFLYQFCEDMPVYFSESSEDSMKKPRTRITRKAVGVFDNYSQLHETIKELETSGFGRRQISIRRSNTDAASILNNPPIAPLHTEVSSPSPQQSRMSPGELSLAQGVLIGAGMYLGAAIAFVNAPSQNTTEFIAIVFGSTALGAIIGMTFTYYLGIWHNALFCNQEENNELALWVDTPDPETIQKATTILQRHGGHDIHVHDVLIAA